MCIMNVLIMLVIENLNNFIKYIYIFDQNICFFGVKDVVEGYKE